MYIAPNSIIKVLRGVPLDTAYDHTIYFATKSDQYTYFNSKAKYTFLEQSYQRVKRGWIRVGRVADDFYDCNYIMFQNSRYGNSKWFYAFIKSVEYINESVSEIEFEIDVMQTWHFNYTLKPCYVEREHTAVGETTSFYTPENLEPGDLVYNDTNYTDLNSMSLCLLFTPQTVQGKIIDNCYLGAGIMDSYQIGGSTTSLDSFIQQITDPTIPGRSRSDIISMYQYPRLYQRASPTDPPIYRRVALRRPSTIKEQNSGVGYTPRNKKLLFYPFSFLRVSDNMGQHNDYCYEYFDDPEGINFESTCTIVPDTTVVVYPIDYKGKTKDFEDKLLIDNFPTCAWATDSFTKWWAENRNGIFYEGISKVISMVGSGGKATALSSPKLGKMGAISAASETLDYIAKTATDVLTAKEAPNEVSGNTSNGNINAACGELYIAYYYMNIRPERATIIDEYFDRYGYTCQRNKIPNTHARPSWCYTKTQGCTLLGTTGVPCDDMKKICAIYDHGITFWKHGDDVGNYSLDNTIDELGDEE